MSRQEGLIQRRNVQTSIAAARSEDTTRLEPDIADKKRLGDDDQDVDADSKETRLTLMEEVLLLGLKDKEVNPNPWASAHRGKLGQLTPLEKWMKLKKRKHAEKEQFSMFMLYFESNQGRQL